MVATVLGGYFIFRKDRCGRYRYSNAMDKKTGDAVEDVALELIDPDMDYLETDNFDIVKAAKMPPYQGNY